MEDEWNIKSQFFLACLEAKERPDVIHKRSKIILAANQIEPYRVCWVGWLKSAAQKSRTGYEVRKF